MFSTRSEWIRSISACVLAIFFAVPVNLMAETAHVVSPSDLQKQAVAATQVRQQNVEKVRNFLSNKVAEQAMQKARIDSGKVRNAVANLSDQELAQLAARAKAQRDFAAGVLTTTDIALIAMGVVIIILIIVIAS